MARRIKIPLDTINTRAEAELMVSDITQITLNQMKLTERMEREIAAVRDKYAKSVAQCEEALTAKTESLRAWAEARPEEFPKDRKSIQFATGAIGFRTGTPALVLLSRKWTWAKALESVQRWLPNFIRNAPEIDKEALIAQRDDKIIQLALQNCGLKIHQAETFYVEPAITETEARKTVAA